MLFLSRQDVETALQPQACIKAMAAALSGLAEGSWHQPPRQQFCPLSASARMGLMPAYRDITPMFGIKDIVVAPGNPGRGLDTHQGVVVLHDGVDGRVLAVVDATAVTAIRTAAVSAVATRALARRGGTVVALLGTGAQAVTHAAAMRCVWPGASLRIWGRSTRHAAAAANLAGASVCATVTEATRDADVICTLTSARTPILTAADVPPGCHVNAVGSSSLDAREIAGNLIAHATRFVDSRAQAVVECGEFALAVRDGVLAADHAVTELGDVLLGRHPGRAAEGEVTLFKSLGLAVEDLAAAELAMHEAIRLGIGTTIDW